MVALVDLKIIPASSISVPSANGGGKSTGNVHGDVAVISLDNPQSKNAMSEEMANVFSNVLTDISEKNSIRCAVLTGKNGLFSSGGDFAMLQSMIDRDPEESVQFMLSFYDKFLKVLKVPFPVIAAVNGHAIGAAFAIALACDLRFFTKEAKYAANFVKLGLHPGMGSTFLLREICGRSLAQELLLTGRFISGTECEEKGICHQAFAKEEVFFKAMTSAKEIAQNSPEAIRLLKQGFFDNTELEKCLEYEANCQSQSFLSKDYKEAMEAIRDKGRHPEFKSD